MVPDAIDPVPERSGKRMAAVLRLVALFGVVLVLPMLLLAATTHPPGCGGG
jgi:hypothetical protein